MEAQCTELDRRLDDLEVEGPVGIPWERAAAAADIEDAYQWYESQQPVWANSSSRR